MAGNPTGDRVDRSEGFGERLLGTMIDRAHEMPPQLIAPLVADVVAAIGGRDVAVYLPDYEQKRLLPLPGTGLMETDDEPIDDSRAGEAFLSDNLVEENRGADMRLFLPLLDGTERVGVLAFTAERPDDDDRRLARRFAGLVADVLLHKALYTDRFFQARRHQPMSLPAEMQWSLLPPLMMTSPQVAVAGMLEPAYDVAGDTFDYALNDDVLHMATIDAMGHGLDAALLATLAVAAYRHARRTGVELPDLYAAMDAAVAGQFTDDHFCTAQMATLDVVSGRLSWVNAGHPHPLLLRNGRVVRVLDSPTTLPIGFGGASPHVSEVTLEQGDRVLFFTDGIIEEHRAGGEQFGEARLIREFERVEQDGGPVAHTVRRLSHALLRARGGQTTDDATLFLLEWRNQPAEHLARLQPVSVSSNR